MRKINFFDGVTTGTPPTIGNIVASDLITYANDAAYEAGELGSPTEGNVYFNTTLNLIRYYNGTSWISLADESSTQTFTNKSISGSTNSLTNLDGDNVIVDTISGLTATNAQGAFAEHQGDINSLVTLSGVSGGSNDLGTFTGTIIPDSSTNKQALQALETEVETKIDLTEKGAANGVATLDGTGKIPASQLRLSLTDWLGNWNASTNTPTLADGAGDDGDIYRVSVAGTQNLGSGSLSFGVGDWAYYSLGVWYKADNVDAVVDVAGKTGSVTLVAADITDFDTEVANNTAVAANTAKVSADGSIDTHSDVDTSTVAPTDQQVLTWVSANSKWEPKDSAGGGGSGQGGINYITNYDAEVDTAGWSTYKDAAQATPVDGTGGSPTITWTRTTYQPLRGSATFLLTKIAGSQQGEGAAYNFTIDTADKAKVLQISAEYIVGSGNFVAGSPGVNSDVTVWIYDVTNATLIQPSSYKFLSNSTTISDKFSATFQSASNSTSYRLLFHVASSSGNAYQLQFDNISVSPSTYVYGTPITDGKSFTPTGSWSTNTTYTGSWKQVGDRMEITYNLLMSGAGTATAFEFDMVPGYTIDSSKINTTQYMAYVGSGMFFDASGTTVYPLSFIYNTGKFQATFNQDSNQGSGGAITSTQPVTVASGDNINATISVPILGWSSSVQTSDQTDTRVIAARAYRSGNQSVSTAAETDIVFNATSFDDVGGFNTSTGVYTVQVPGKYRVKTSLYISSAASEVFTIAIYKTGVQVAQRFFTATNDAMTEVGDVINCVTGDTIKSTIDSTADTSYIIIGSSVATFTTIERISGPSAIAATESITMRAYTAATSISTATETVVNGTIDWDSHGAYNSTTGIYTCPVSGKYRVTGSVRFESAVIGVGGVQELYFQKNSGSNIAVDRGNWSSGTLTIMLGGEMTFNCLAGDTIKMKAYNTTTTALAGGDANYFEVERIGN